MESSAPVFISTEEASQLLAANAAKFIDCTTFFTPADGCPILSYKSKHIQGAIFFDLRYIRDVASPFSYMLCSEQTFSDYLRLNSIKTSSRVILYDQNPAQPYWATRAFWMFRTFGLKNVSVLDGGLSKWVSEGRPTHSDADAGTQDDYKVKVDESILRLYPQIAEIEKEIAAGNSDYQIIDARSEPMYAAGHIPVSKSLPCKNFFNDDGTVKQPDQIKQILSEAGIDTSKPIINSCGGGITGSYNFAA